MTGIPKHVGSAPSQSQLHEAALRHLARYGTTQAGLVRVLDRRVHRWARMAASDGMETDEAVRVARRVVREVAAALVQAGVIDDAAFAEARTANLTRVGRSRRAVAAHLAMKGVAAEVAQAALPEPEKELSSALAFARRRRLGPFRKPGDEATHIRDLGVMARAGFPREVADQALGMAPDEAEAIVLAIRRA